MSDDEDLRGLDDAAFDALEDEVERLAAESELGLPADEGPQPKSGDALDPVHSEADFEEIVRQAVDELPSEYLRALEALPSSSRTTGTSAIGTACTSVASTVTNQ
jgi:hypothetical protein